MLLCGINSFVFHGIHIGFLVESSYVLKVNNVLKLPRSAVNTGFSSQYVSYAVIICNVVSMT